jgi:hypothetical protein
VQGGIYSPNEARNLEDLDTVKDGDEPRLQQQVVPLSAASAIQPSAHGPKIPAAPPAEGQPPAAAIPAPKKSNDDVRESVRRLFAAAERAGRRFN